MQVKVVDFTIVNETTSVACSEKIKALLAESWALHGPLTVICPTTGDSPTKFVQALVKVEYSLPPGMGSDLALPPSQLLRR